MAHPLSIKLKLGASSSASSSTPTSTPASLAVPHHIPQPSLEPVGPSYSQSQSPAAAPAPAPARPQQPPAAPAPAPPPPTAAAVREGEGEQEVEGERPVAATKYRELKRKLILQTTSQNDTSLALFRAQKLIHRLREEKSSLLDRVLLLESAANLTSAQVDAAQDETIRSHHAQSFPLLHPTPLPSLGDRPRPTPILNTSTDLSHSSYNDPIGEPPAPLSFPPRQRSTHLVSQLAAQKIRNDAEARRAAQGLPKPNFHAVSILGLEGSYVAENVERAMMGEQYPEPGAVYAEQKPSTSGGGTKRRRGSESNGRAAAGKSKVVEAPGAVYQGLPNPFAGAGATPIPVVEASPAPPPQQQHYGSASVSVEPQQQGDIDMDDDTRSFGTGAAYSDDESAVGGGGGAEPKEFVVKERKHRKIEGEKTIKPKRLKTHGITSGTYQIPHVPRNPDGTPRLPIPIGIMILRKLGTVTPREHFHTERYIFPIGFEAMRKYPSMIDRTETVEYACTIVDGGDGAPRFEIHPADQPGVIISAGTPTGAWSQVVKAANRVRERNHSNSVSGPDYYGLAQNVVKALIQELPGAREVPGYIWQTFVEDPDPSTVEETGRKKRGGVAGGEGGPKKVTGARRKARLESEGMEEGGSAHGGDGQQYGYPGQQHQQHYDGGMGGSNGGYESSQQRSPSPVTSPGGGGYPSHHHPTHDAFNAPSSSSLASLLHHAAQAQTQVSPAPPPADPYALPGVDPSFHHPHHHHSPAFSAPSPYALPGAPPPPIDPYAIPPPSSSFHQSPPLQQQGSPHLQQHAGGWNAPPPPLPGVGAVDPMFQQQQSHGQSYPPPSTTTTTGAGISPALDPSFY